MKSLMWFVVVGGWLFGVFLWGCASPEPEPDKKCVNDKSTYETMFTPGDPCFQRDASLNIENISAVDKNVSHNFGRNCMQCHQKNGPGIGLFTVGGSIYKDGKPYAGAVVKFFADPARKNLVLELRSDKLGNVYTTKDDKLKMPSSSYFVSVTNADGSVVKVMRGPKSSGACNQCHNSGFPITLDK